MWGSRNISGDVAVVGARLDDDNGFLMDFQNSVERS